MKKKPIKKYIKDHNIELSILGIRKSEGGVRSVIYKSCFEDGEYKKFFPLFHFTNQDINDIIKLKNIEISKAYTLYKMERTGCVGCPFSKNYQKELEVLKQYEPNKYNFCIKTYGKIYEIYKKR